MEDHFTPHDVLLSRKEAAELLKICCTTLDRLSEIKRVHLRRRVFYRRATLEAYLFAQEQQKEQQEVKNG